MQPSPSPWASPSASLDSDATPRAPSGDLLGSFHAKSNLSDKGLWKLEIYAEDLRLTSEDGATALVLSRAELVDRARIFMVGNAPPLMTVKKTPKGKPIANVQLDADALPVLRAWIAPVDTAYLGAVFRERWSIAWIIIFALLIAFSGTPSLSMASIRQYGYSFAVIALGTLGRLKPHRGLFLLEAGASAFLAGKIGYQVALEGQSWFWLIAAFFILLNVVSTLRMFKFFTPVPASR